MPRFQVYGTSAQADRLLVWRLIKDATPRGSTHVQTLGLKSFLAHSTRTGSRSCRRVWVRLTICLFLDPGTEPV